MSETTERASSIGGIDFLQQYIPLQQAGKTREEIATAMNMKKGSFDTKLSNLYTDVYAGTTVIRIGEGEDVREVTGETLVDESDGVLSLRKVRQGIDKGTYHVVTSGQKVPMPKNSRSKRNLASLGNLVAKLLGNSDDES